jgi:hypothetical protein
VINILIADDHADAQISAYLVKPPGIEEYFAAIRSPRGRYAAHTLYPSSRVSPARLEFGHICRVYLDLFALVADLAFLALGLRAEIAGAERGCCESEGNPRGGNQCPVHSRRFYFQTPTASIGRRFRPLSTCGLTCCCPKTCTMLGTRVECPQPHGGASGLRAIRRSSYQRTGPHFIGPTWRPEVKPPARPSTRRPKPRPRRNRRAVKPR